MKTSIDKKGVKSLIKMKVRLKDAFFLFRKRQTQLAFSRVAFVFPAKVGKAVKRNRFKRRIRELVRLYGPTACGCDYLCSARGALKRVTNHDWQCETEAIKRMLDEDAKSVGAPIS